MTIIRNKQIENDNDLHENDSSNSYLDSNKIEEPKTTNSTNDLESKTNQSILDYSFNSNTLTKNRCLICFKLVLNLKGNKLSHYYDLNAYKKDFNNFEFENCESAYQNDLSKSPFKQVEHAHGINLLNKSKLVNDSHERHINESVVNPDSNNKNKNLVRFGCSDDEFPIFLNNKSINNKNKETDESSIQPITNLNLTNQNQFDKNKTNLIENNSKRLKTIGDQIQNALNDWNISNTNFNSNLKSRIEVLLSKNCIYMKKICENCFKQICLIDYHMNYAFNLCNLVTHRLKKSHKLIKSFENKLKKNTKKNFNYQAHHFGKNSNLMNEKEKQTKNFEVDSTHLINNKNNINELELNPNLIQLSKTNLKSCTKFQNVNQIPCNQNGLVQSSNLDGDINSSSKKSSLNQYIKRKCFDGFKSNTNKINKNKISKKVKLKSNLAKMNLLYNCENKSFYSNKHYSINGKNNIKKKNGLSEKESQYTNTESEINNNLIDQENKIESDSLLLTNPTVLSDSIPRNNAGLSYNHQSQVEKFKAELKIAENSESENILYTNKKKDSDNFSNLYSDIEIKNNEKEKDIALNNNDIAFSRRKRKSINPSRLMKANISNEDDLINRYANQIQDKLNDTISGKLIDVRKKNDNLLSDKVFDNLNNYKLRENYLSEKYKIETNSSLRNSEFIKQKQINSGKKTIKKLSINQQISINFCESETPSKQLNSPVSSKLSYNSTTNNIKNIVNSDQKFVNNTSDDLSSKNNPKIYNEKKIIDCNSNLKNMNAKKVYIKPIADNHFDTNKIKIEYLEIVHKKTLNNKITKENSKLNNKENDNFGNQYEDFDIYDNDDKSIPLEDNDKLNGKNVNNIESNQYDENNTDPNENLENRINKNITNDVRNEINKYDDKSSRENFNKDNYDNNEDDNENNDDDDDNNYEDEDDVDEDDDGDDDIENNVENDDTDSEDNIHNTGHDNDNHNTDEENENYATKRRIKNYELSHQRHTVLDPDGEEIYHEDENNQNYTENELNNEENEFLDGNIQNYESTNSNEHESDNFVETEQLDNDNESISDQNKIDETFQNNFSNNSENEINQDENEYESDIDNIPRALHQKIKNESTSNDKLTNFNFEPDHLNTKVNLIEKVNGLDNFTESRANQGFYKKSNNLKSNIKPNLITNKHSTDVLQNKNRLFTQKNTDTNMNSKKGMIVGNNSNFKNSNKINNNKQIVIYSKKLNQSIFDNQNNFPSNLSINKTNSINSKTPSVITINTKNYEGALNSSNNYDNCFGISSSTVGNVQASLDENSNNSIKNDNFISPSLSSSPSPPNNSSLNLIVSNQSSINPNINGGSNTSSTKHACEVCKKTFKTQNILRQHMRIHTGDKPFVCEVCLKAFSQMASLKYHLATHSDARPYRCETCSKTFKLKPPFKKHIKECQPKQQPSSSPSNNSSSSYYYNTSTLNNNNMNSSGLDFETNEEEE